MKTNWQTKKLSDACFFQEGPGIRKYEYKKNGYPIINVRCVQDGYVDLSNAQAVDPKFVKEKWSHFQVEEGDILFTTSGTIGRTSMATKNDLPLLMNTSVVRFKSLDEKELDKYFLAWLLRSPKFIEEVKSYSSGTAQKNVGPTHLKMISISYPPIPEQKRIVKILDEAFGKIEKAKENAEKNLKNSKELFESYLQNVFANPGKDWEEKKLGEVYDVRDGTHDSPKYQKEGYALITSKNLKEGKLDYQKIKYISEKDYKKINERSRVHKGDILFAMIGTIGNPVVIEVEPDFAIKNVALFKIPKDQDSYFLKYYLDSKFVIDKMLGEAKGTTQQFVGLGYLRDFKIKIPNLNAQKMVVKRLDSLSEQIKKLEAVYQKKLADLEELKKSVLNKAFTEEL